MTSTGRFPLPALAPLSASTTLRQILEGPYGRESFLGLVYKHLCCPAKVLPGVSYEKRIVAGYLHFIQFDLCKRSDHTDVRAIVKSGFLSSHQDFESVSSFRYLEARHS